MFSSPLYLQATATSSTSIRTTWPALPPTAETADTKSLIGYLLFYKQTSADSYQKIGVASGTSALEMILEELKKYTPYRMVVCPYSEKGNGIPSPPASDTTFEDGKQRFGLKFCRFYMFLFVSTPRIAKNYKKLFINFVETLDRGRGGSWGFRGRGGPWG